jgi:hypothetical protein
LSSPNAGPDHIRVEIVEPIVGELSKHRRNKVFQVVTLVAQGSAAIIAGLSRMFQYCDGPKNFHQFVKNTVLRVYRDF